MYLTFYVYKTNKRHLFGLFSRKKDIELQASNYMLMINLCQTKNMLNVLHADTF